MDELSNKLRDDHHNFDLNQLDLAHDENPFDLFNAWLAHAVDSNCIEANACVISTVNEFQQPSMRIVYLKELVDNQFIFYTNYLSEKGKNIAQNPAIAMHFFWPSLQQQVRIEGIVEKVSATMSDAYFKSRPRASQIGAWASEQSNPLESREALEERVRYFEAKFHHEVPRPDHWGGYALTPNRFEFWQGRSSRLHDRFAFESQTNSTWSICRLNP